MDTTYVLTFLVFTSLAGLAGAAAMAGVLGLFKKLGISSINMLGALGSLITKERQRAVRTGLVIHAVAGVLFAMVYGLIILGFGFRTPVPSMLVGFGFGLFHGIIVSFMLAFVVRDVHPLPEVQRGSLAVGAAYLFVHIIYGAVVGLIIGLAPL